jgi:hypothetical protein
MIMKKNWIVFPVVLLILAGIACFAVLSCGGDSGPSIETYTGKGEQGTEYKLVVTDNKTYELFINDESISTGKVSKSGDVFTLTPDADGEPFYVTVSGNKITKIEGVITPNNGGDPIIPENIKSDGVAGVWTWALSDDSQPNPHITPQTVFAPGGASRFTTGKYTEDSTEKDRYGDPVKRPFAYPAGTVKDDDGNTIDATVFNFKGKTEVSTANRPADSGAGFPLLGWEAVPDTETLELLKTAYGYSFWVRLNSVTASNAQNKDKWAFVTSIVTDYEEEKGYEHKHWYGNLPGDSGGTTKINNYTKDLKLGVWYQIIVVINKDSDGFNINQDKWMHQYIPANPTTPKDIADKAAFDHPYDQSMAEKLQWQVQLQHNGGTARVGTPYDIVNGSYDFDLDFYGLELMMD